MNINTFKGLLNIHIYQNHVQDIWEEETWKNTSRLELKWYIEPFIRFVSAITWLCQQRAHDCTRNWRLDYAGSFGDTRILQLKYGQWNSDFPTWDNSSVRFIDRKLNCERFHMFSKYFICDWLAVT